MRPVPNSSPVVVQGYPLGLLFVAIALVAALLALDAAVMKDAAFERISAERLLGNFVIATVIGFLLGIIVGAYHFHRLGILVGGGVGAVLVPLLLPVLMAREDHTLQVLIATVIGCGSMLGIATMIRLGVWRRQS